MNRWTCSTVALLLAVCLSGALPVSAQQEPYVIIVVLEEEKTNVTVTFENCVQGQLISS